MRAFAFLRAGIPGPPCKASPPGPCLCTPLVRWHDGPTHVFYCAGSEHHLVDFANAERAFCGEGFHDTAVVDCGIDGRLCSTCRFGRDIAVGITARGLSWVWAHRGGEQGVESETVPPSDGDEETVEDSGERARVSVVVRRGDDQEGMEA